jgi:hypothetical protein
VREAHVELTMRRRTLRSWVFVADIKDESARAPPCPTHQSDEKERLDSCVAALERQVEELKAKVAELEAALELKQRPRLKHSRRRATSRNASVV